MGWLKSIGKELGRAAGHIADVAIKPAEAISKGLGEAAKPVVEGAGYLWNELNGTNAMLKSAELQNDYNLKYWQMQNAYNTPSAQMQRFIDAGLNPNLAYSLSNTAGDVGRVNVGTPDSALGVASKVVGAISAWQGIKNMRLQNDNLSYQGDYVKTQNALAGAQLDRYIWDTQWLKDHNISSFSPQIERQLSSGVSWANRYNPFNVPARALGRLVGYLSTGINYRDDRDKGWNRTAFNYWKNPL